MKYWKKNGWDFACSQIVERKTRMLLFCYSFLNKRLLCWLFSGCEPAGRPILAMPSMAWTVQTVPSSSTWARWSGSAPRWPGGITVAPQLSTHIIPKPQRDRWGTRTYSHMHPSILYRGLSFFMNIFVYLSVWISLAVFFFFFSTFYLCLL